MRPVIVAVIAVDSSPSFHITLDGFNCYNVRNLWGRNLGPSLTRAKLLSYVRGLTADSPRIAVERRWPTKHMVAVLQAAPRGGAK